MLIRDKLAEGPTLSFELFPPRAELGFWSLRDTIGSLCPLSPDFVSVTCSPVRHGALTVELTARIHEDIGLEGMAHRTCVGFDRALLTESLDELRCRGVRNILALRGDIPPSQHKMAFGHAADLVAFIRQRHPDTCIGAACHPETHPEAEGAEQDLDNLKRKVDAGADFLITQLFFDNADFLRFRDRAGKAGIGVPIVAGVMPVVDAGQIKKFTGMCGASIPADLLARIDAVGDDAEAVRHIGTFHATQQCLGLLREGVAGLHFYTLNKSTATRVVFQYIRHELTR